MFCFISGEQHTETTLISGRILNEIIWHSARMEAKFRKAKFGPRDEITKIPKDKPEVCPVMQNMDPQGDLGLPELKVSSAASISRTPTIMLGNPCIVSYGHN